MELNLRGFPSKPQNLRKFIHAIINLCVTSKQFLALINNLITLQNFSASVNLHPIIFDFIFKVISQLQKSFLVF